MPHPSPERWANEVFPVVGVGASAGGLEAFSELLANLPRDVPMAVVLVQHLDPKHSSLLTELLTRTTPMSVVEVRPGTRVEPSHVYVIPPNTTMTIADGVLQLSPRPHTNTPHMPIDLFFRSLAEDRGDKAIGVVLSGSASDGALGIKAIKGEGGVTFAQDPDTAKQDGMPRSAIASGAVDFVLPPRGIALELARIGRHPYLRDPVEPAVEAEASDERALAQIYRMLQQETGVDFRLYRQTTIRRRIARRMLVHRIDTVERYQHYLDEHRPELPLLYNEVLINVTRFFRDPEAFEALQHALQSRLARSRGLDQSLRVWVPGCATGEEAYSLAMALVEALDGAGAKIPLQVFGTDVSDAAITRARGASIPRTSSWTCHPSGCGASSRSWTASTRSRNRSARCASSPVTTW
jgi:two-component system CheB/CheR fusion protein